MSPARRPALLALVAAHALFAVAQVAPLWRATAHAEVTLHPPTSLGAPVDRSWSVVSGIRDLWRADEVMLSALVCCFSLLWPHAKLLLSAWHHFQRPAPRLARWSARWAAASSLDVLFVALVAACLSLRLTLPLAKGLEAAAEVKASPRWGTVVFGIAVGASVLAARAARVSPGTPSRLPSAVQLHKASSCDGKPPAVQQTPSAKLTTSFALPRRGWSSSRLDGALRLAALGGGFLALTCAALTPVVDVSYRPPDLAAPEAVPAAKGAVLGVIAKMRADKLAADMTGGGGGTVGSTPPPESAGRQSQSGRRGLNTAHHVERARVLWPAAAALPRPGAAVPLARHQHHHRRSAAETPAAGEMSMNVSTLLPFLVNLEHPEVFVTDGVIKAALGSAPPPSLPPAARLSLVGLVSRLAQQGGFGGALLGSALLAVGVIAPAVRLGGLGYATTLAGVPAAANLRRTALELADAAACCCAVETALLALWVLSARLAPLSRYLSTTANACLGSNNCFEADADLLAPGIAAMVALAIALPLAERAVCGPAGAGGNNFGAADTAGSRGAAGDASDLELTPVFQMNGGEHESSAAV